MTYIYKRIYIQMFKNKFQIKNKTQSLTDRGTSRKTGHLSFSNWSKGILSFTNQTFTGVGPWELLHFRTPPPPPPPLLLLMTHHEKMRLKALP